MKKPSSTLLRRTFFGILVMNLISLGAHWAIPGFETACLFLHLGTALVSILLGTVALIAFFLSLLRNRSGRLAYGLLFTLCVLSVVLHRNTLRGDLAHVSDDVREAAAPLIH